MKKLCMAALALSVAAAIGCDKQSEFANETPAQQPRSSAVQAVVAAKYAGPLVQLDGTPQQIGDEHAQDLDTQIKTLHHKYLDTYIGTGAKRFLALGAAKLFESYCLPEHLNEIEALAKHESMDERE